MAVTLYEESKGPAAAFYTPYFEIHIQGAGLPRDVLRDVTSLTYSDNIGELDGFTLTVNNWEPSSNSFKYIGSETLESLKGDTPQSRLYRLFEPLRHEVEVRLGYAGLQRVMLTGHVVSVQPNFPSGGAPTLTVTGLNVMHELRTKRFTTDWKKKTDSQIAEAISSLIDPATGRKRFPLDIFTDPQAKGAEPQIDYIAQKSEYDLSFLFARAKERGYVIFVQEADPKDKNSKRRLYFGPSSTKSVPGWQAVTYKLEWGKSIIDFKPVLSTANQVASVTVHGWNRNTHREITAKVSLKELTGPTNKDLFNLLTTVEREEVVVNEPVFDDQEARRRAVAVLSDRQKELVKASVTTVGLPDLRAGRTVEILGVGSRLSGSYFITDTSHTIDSGGYRTSFNARRETALEGGAK